MKKTYILKQDRPNIGKEVGDYYNGEYGDSEERIKELIEKGIIEEEKDEEETNDLFCKHCKGPLAERNPSGYCDHLYYPEACAICTKYEKGGPMTATAILANINKRSRLISELGALLMDEDLTDEKLRKASEDLLPRVHDYLLELHKGSVE